MAQVMELTDELAGLALFADLPRPQLEAVAHEFEEAWFGEGDRILRQGLTGSGFYVILEGEVAIRASGRDVAVLGRGDFFGEVSVLLGELPSADVVAIHSHALSAPCRTGPARLPAGSPCGDVPDAARSDEAPPEHDPCPRLTTWRPYLRLKSATRDHSPRASIRWSWSAAARAGCSSATRCAVLA